MTEREIEDLDHPLRAARGIVTGIIVSVIVWAVLLGLLALGEWLGR